MKLLISLGLALALFILEAFQPVATYLGRPEKKRPVRGVMMEPSQQASFLEDFSIHQKASLVESSEDFPGMDRERPIQLPVRIIAADYPKAATYPFTPIQFCLSHQAEVSLQIFDAAGRPYGPKVRVALAAGWHRLELDASQLSPGIYIYRLQTHEATFTRKMLVLK